MTKAEAVRELQVRVEKLEDVVKKLGEEDVSLRTQILVLADIVGDLRAEVEK